ncbi:MAG TPA: hypothetical protein VNK04_07665 [Gemmataceae bacterium]|nr:hypothetical protein [Gemmataceae bacterium]
MSLLGKILAVLNVLAAVGFFLLASMDYGKRQYWTHAVFRHDLALHGLPLDAEERDLEGEPVVRQIDAATLNELFGGAGNPVKTQLEEVQRVRQELQAKIDGPPFRVSHPLEPQKKLELTTRTQKLAWALRPFAFTAARREALNRLMVGGKDITPDELAGAFDAKFEEELSKLEPAKRPEAIADYLQKELTEKVLNLPGEKRPAIAQLLFGWAELSGDEGGEPDKGGDLSNSPAYKRVVAVVGVEMAAQALNARANDLAQVARGIRAGMVRDRQQFTLQHAAWHGRLLDAADYLHDREAELQRETQGAAAQQELLNARKKEVADLEARLAAKQAETLKLLQKQDRLQQELFKAQQVFRDAATKNLELEREVRTLEKGR